MTQNSPYVSECTSLHQRKKYNTDFDLKRGFVCITIQCLSNSTSRGYFNLINQLFTFEDIYSSHKHQVIFSPIRQCIVGKTCSFLIFKLNACSFFRNECTFFLISITISCKILHFLFPAATIVYRSEKKFQSNVSLVLKCCTYVAHTARQLVRYVTLIYPVYNAKLSPFRKSPLKIYTIICL